MVGKTFLKHTRAVGFEGNLISDKRTSNIRYMKILAIVPILRDDPSEIIRSLTEQTNEVSKIVVVVGSKTLQSLLLKSLNILSVFT